ncbi:MAG: metalloregulator ArsR/SmtB family transcription factor [Solirubrobacteraceae bacterium]
MLADADLAAVAALMGDAKRASMLLALLGGEELPARDLAARARASSSLASSHLAKLTDGGLLAVERRGRNRYYRLADRHTAEAIEAILAIAPHRRAHSLRESSHGEAIRHARTCYDHLAGALGIALTDSLQYQGMIGAPNDGFPLTPAGQARLSGLGLDIEALQRGRRALTRPCLDWTERRPHLAGSLAAALAARLLELDWIRRRTSTRALTITDTGRRQLRTELDVNL